MPGRKALLWGIFPPVPTAFGPDGALDVPAFQTHVGRMAAAGVAGVVALGSNGEAAHLSEDERLRVLEAARAALPPPGLLLAGTGFDGTRPTIAFTRRAAQAGADAAVVVTPSYFRRHIDRRGWITHYHAIAEASPIPVVIYNMPPYTGVDLDGDVIAELAQHPNIAGLKDSSGDVRKLAALVAAVPNHFSVLAGSFGFLLAALSVGARGGILALANLAPRACLELAAAAAAGSLEEAERLQQAYQPLNGAVTAHYGVPGLKAAMALCRMPVGPPRSPLLPLGEQDQRELAVLLREAGLLAPGGVRAPA